MNRMESRIETELEVRTYIDNIKYALDRGARRNNMKVISSMKKLCTCCMEVHDVKIVEVKESNTFKGQKIDYIVTYNYCDAAEEFYSDELMIEKNDISMKDAYRRQNRLLTYAEIAAVRKKYSISQKDLAILLGWGEKTITRYEGHQVQDMAHDSILRKIDSDPEWFLELLEKGKDKIPESSYKKYKKEISKVYKNMQDEYLRKSIQAQYITYEDEMHFGKNKLNFEKIVDTICYYANSGKVKNLFKVKLMKMLWYADFLSYKRYNHSITGLIYMAKPMGALPIGHKSIIDLNGIIYEEIEFENGSGYKFIKNGRTKYSSLTDEDILVLDNIIDIFGNSTTEDIVKKMHNELAYKETEVDNVISYEYAKDLSIA